jgi:hypothetical protein
MPTPRRQLPTISDTDNVDVPGDLNALATSLDHDLRGFHGLEAARAAFAPPTAEGGWKDDERWFSTDTGVEWIRQGSGFVALNPKDAAANVASMRTLGTGSTQAAAGNDPRFSTPGRASFISPADQVPSGPAAAATPDRISNLVVPAGGVLLVSLWLLLEKNGGGTGETASVLLYLNGVQVRSRFGSAPPGVSAGVFGLTGLTSGYFPTTDAVVSTDVSDAGLGVMLSGNGGPGVVGASGKIGGMFVPIEVDPGTYTLEVRYGRSAGFAGTVSNRRLRARVESFD